MSVRSSVPSVTSPSQPNRHLAGDLSAMPPSISIVSKIPPVDSVDPDELFAKYTITEVKVAQRKLRADANAKQEELRLMVGERYRDLIQASTSIISIAQSSKRVSQALEEVKSRILSEQEPPQPKRNTVHNNDSQLYIMQVLSAHMKLLLDAPEHMWRLIEKKQFFVATWLFLLSRVVHRALVREDETDQSWAGQGLDVLDQFPLIQRQWESVSQFRPQIIHKATLTLREYNMTATDTCATLLALHFMDSRPLTDTFTTLLEQRSKTLQKLVFWQSNQLPTSPSSPIAVTNRTAHGTSKSSSREIRQTMLAVLNAISRTISVSREVFQQKGTSPSLIESVLEFTQADHVDAESSALPHELQLTTQSLLATLPSSTHFLLLPQNLKAYRPYIDVSSPSSFVLPTVFKSKMDEWFNQAVSKFDTSAERWLAGIHVVKDVWSLRCSLQRWIQSSSGLGSHEINSLAESLNLVSSKRIIDIWRAEFSVAVNAFQKSLHSAISTSENLGFEKGQLYEGCLFRAPALPVASQTSQPSSTFPKYSAALRMQIIGRSSLLDSVVKTLEQCVRSLQSDMRDISSNDSKDTQSLVKQLEVSCQPGVKSLCNDVLDSLKLSLQTYDEEASGIHGLVFVGKVTKEICASPFILDLRCGDELALDFRMRSAKISSAVITRWRKYTVSHVIKQYRQRKSAKFGQKYTISTSSAPSPILLDSLLSLTTALRQLGPYRNPEEQKATVDDTIRLFINQVVSGEWDIDYQSLHDLALLQKLSSRGTEWEDVIEVIETKIIQIRKQVINGGNFPDFAADANDCLTRSQLIFSIILPPLESHNGTILSLLRYGAPSKEKALYSIMDVAQPSPRFGLLLVASR